MNFRLEFNVVCEVGDTVGMGDIFDSCVAAVENPSPLGPHPVSVGWPCELRERTPLQVIVVIDMHITRVLPFDFHVGANAGVVLASVGTLICIRWGQLALVIPEVGTPLQYTGNGCFGASSAPCNHVVSRSPPCARTG